jgi:hypothetical protein
MFQGHEILRGRQGAKGAILASRTRSTVSGFVPAGNAVLHQNFVSDYQAK